MKTKPATTRIDDGDATPVRRRRAGAPKPTGANVPTEAPAEVDPAVQAAMERVRPAPGYALVRLVLGSERASAFGLPADTKAIVEAAMVRVLALDPSDDDIARDVPVGSVVFASLEGIAPLLASYAYLLPIERIQGIFPTDVAPGTGPLGFEAEATTAAAPNA
jgi:hypothetical protein